MKKAEDEDRKMQESKKATKPRKQQKTKATQSALDTGEDGEEEDDRDDAQRKKVKARPTDEELIKTFCLFWEKRVSTPAYEPPSLRFSGEIRGEIARMMVENSHNMIALQFRRRLYQNIRFRYAKEGELQLDAKDTKRLVESCYRVKEAPAQSKESNKTEGAVPTSIEPKKSSKPKKPKMIKVWDKWDGTEDPVERELRK